MGREYEGDVYARIKQVNQDAGMDDRWGLGSEDIANQTAGDYSRAEEQRLQQGQEMRGDGPDPDADYLGYSHEQLYDMVHNDLDSAEINARGDDANEMANWLSELAEQATRATQAEQSQWQGQSANQAHGFVTGVATWAATNSNAAGLSANRFSQQSQTAQEARNAMPEPSGFSQGAEMAQARQQIEGGQVYEGLITQAGIAAKQAAAQEAHEQAAQVLHGMDEGYYRTASTQPAFTAPPLLSGQALDGRTAVSGFLTAPGGHLDSPVSTGSGSFTGSGSLSGGSPNSAGVLSGSGQLPGQLAGTNPGAATTSTARPIPGAGAPVPMAGPPGSPLGNGGSNITREPRRGGIGGGGIGGGGLAGARVSGGGYLPKNEAAGRPESDKAPGKNTGTTPTTPKEGPTTRGGPAAVKASPAGTPSIRTGSSKSKTEDTEHQRKYIQDEPVFEPHLTEGPHGERVVPPIIGER